VRICNHLVARVNSALANWGGDDLPGDLVSTHALIMGAPVGAPQTMMPRGG
jgi:hypothetical protein